ncbi:flavin reductase family protein [Actinokineospora sp. NBRC 105648]|uniref:flavin reductase family protein n=1 Tax=Actinokineospora sp. NBRC 105648 TaxID=3032206 RepID=UPI0024A10804|nr:flavin reductase family protein [Actinokineospora sp. NBRC 105648]GLZ39227.1 oxidoreductase [Actinokineospora sp. NBRC 105648]
MITEQTSSRVALRKLASGVAVLTFRDGDRAHAATVSSVTAVSRDPLLLGTCLRVGSVFADLVREPGARFAVNILGAHQAAFASWFADPRRPRGLAQFDCVDWTPDPYSGAPLIAGSLAGLGCGLRSHTPAGDHHLLVAEVFAGVPGEGAPLLSYAGQLHDGTLRSLPERQAHPGSPQEGHLMPETEAVR